jgi:uncharacterized protein (TIGR03435 family)
MKPDKLPGKALAEFFERVPRASERQTEEAGPRLWRRIALESGAPLQPMRLERPRPQRRLSRIALAAAAAAVVLSVTGVAYRELLKRGASTRTALQVVNGNVQRTADRGSVGVGARVEGGEVVLSKEGGVVALPDGSRIEMRPNTEVRLEAADDGARIRLNRGSVIVTAAKQRSGHLYVQTRDVIVSVTGTVFLVNAEETGSRVAVIEGEVRVQQSGASRSLRPGEQVATNPSMEPHFVSEQISWSRHAEEHLALLQQATITPRPPVPLRFDVTSIKPISGWGPIGLSCRGSDGVWNATWANGGSGNGDPSSYPVVAPQGRCLGRGVRVSSLIAFAYGIPSEYVSNVPAWDRATPGGSNGFEIEGAAENPATATREQLKQMLQAMLADRFKLTLHREFRDGQGYALRVGRRGAKLKEVMEQERSSPWLFFANGQRTLRGKTGLSELAHFLGTTIHSVDVAGGIEHVPVVDKTQLTGIYDYELVLPSVGIPGGARGDGAAPGGLPSDSDAASALSDALEEQLGLRLQKEKVSIEAIVIDHVEPPSPN